MPGGRTHAPTTQRPRRGKSGRPSSLTEETIQLIERRILNLSSYRDAAIAAGIDETTFQRWMRRGRDDFDLARPSEYNTFYQRVEVANGKVKAVLQGRVYAGSTRDPRLALKILERRWPDEWGLKIKVQDATPAPKSSPRDRLMKRLADAEDRQERATKALEALARTVAPET